MNRTTLAIETVVTPETQRRKSSSSANADKNRSASRKRSEKYGSPEFTSALVEAFAQAAHQARLETEALDATASTAPDARTA